MRGQMVKFYRTLRRPLRRHFRTKRMEDFCRILGITSDTQVLDVGGLPEIWALSPVHPHVTFLNVCLPREGSLPCEWIQGDGCRLPFKNGSFDVVFSNSVIEHLGSFENQKQFADEITRVGRSFFVQTPYRWFVIEPHLMTPLVHFLPRKWEKRLLRNFTLRGLLARPSPEWWSEWFEGIRLLDKRGFARLFPDASIHWERTLGLTKSLLAFGSVRSDYQASKLHAPDRGSLTGSRR
jgi:hypothetical protein